MRFHVEVVEDPSGRIVGTVTPEGRPSSPFEGWLELAHLLVDRTDDDHEDGEEP